MEDAITGRADRHEGGHAKEGDPRAGNVQVVREIESKASLSKAKTSAEGEGDGVRDVDAQRKTAAVRSDIAEIDQKRGVREDILEDVEDVSDGASGQGKPRQPEHALAVIEAHPDFLRREGNRRRGSLHGFRGG